MINSGTIPRMAARLSLGLSAAFPALLAALHVLEPEFNSGHVISEYQLGDYGVLAFCLLGAARFCSPIPPLPIVDAREVGALLSFLASLVLAGFVGQADSPMPYG
jgi:hypothetical protein